MAVSLDAALVAYLRSKSNLTDAVGQRIRSGKLAPKLGALPEICFERAASSRVPCLDGSDATLAKSYLIELFVRDTERNRMIAIMEDLVRECDELTGATVSVANETAVFTEATVEDDPVDLDPELITEGGTTRAVESRSLLIHVLF